MHDALQQLVDSNRRLARQAKGDAVDASMLPMRELAQALAEPDCDFSALDSDDACLCAVEKVPDLVQRRGLAVYVVRLADNRLLGLQALRRQEREGQGVEGRRMEVACERDGRGRGQED